MRRPSFHDLTPQEQARFGNGLGPFWLPDWVRAFITGAMSWFFQNASWRHHDFGYAVGGDEFDRRRCDWRFLMAMLRDAVSQPRWIWLIAAPIAIFNAVLFYLAVRTFGWMGSFEYRCAYASLEEVRTAYMGADAYL